MSWKKRKKNLSLFSQSFLLLLILRLQAFDFKAVCCTVLKRLNIDFPIAFEQNRVTSIAYELF